MRHHRLRHRLRCYERSAQGLEPERPRRSHAGQAVGGWPTYLSWHFNRRLPQLVHHHWPAKPIGAVEYAGIVTGANSWYMSANIAGKPRAFLPYLGPEGVGGYRRKCDEIAA